MGRRRAPEHADGTAELTTGLESLLGQLTAAPGRWILIIEDARTPVHYVQFLAYEDGSLLAEVVSNCFIDQLQDTHPRWDEAQKKKKKKKLAESGGNRLRRLKFRTGSTSGRCTPHRSMLLLPARAGPFARSSG